jgi:hypothetical protein
VSSLDHHCTEHEKNKKKKPSKKPKPDTKQQNNITIPNWASGSQNSPWRYGGPNRTNTNGPDTVGPGGTIEEVEEGGTAPITTAQPAQPTTTTILPVPVAATTYPPGIDPYDHRQPPQHTHYYHLNDNNDRSRRRGRRSRHRTGDGVDDGILGLVERQRDSERQMADTDASHRREAMMIELMERARRDHHRGSGGGGDGGAEAGAAAGEGKRGRLDARDILGVLLDDVVERRGRRRRRSGCGDAAAGDGVDDDGDDGGWKGALDALSRRVEEMVLQGREEDKDKDKARGRAAARSRGLARTTTNTTARNEARGVKFNEVGRNSGSAGRDSYSSSNSNNNNNTNTAGGPSGGKKGGAASGPITFSRRGRADTDTDETGGPSSSSSSAVNSGRGPRTTRGRTSRRAWLPSP